MIFGLRRVKAFSLVELTVALGVAAFCLLAVFGLMPIGVQTNRNTTSQTAAANIMAAVIADIRTTAKATASATPSQLYLIQIPAGGSSNTTPQILYFDGAGQFASTLAPPSPTPFQPRYILSVTFPQVSPAPSPALPPTYADLKVIWPAVSPTPAVPSGSVEMFGAFQRN
jgi:type II secretory pathway pseudopilin PulG